jgi:hypothetical protein
MERKRQGTPKAAEERQEDRIMNQNFSWLFGVLLAFFWRLGDSLRTPPALEHEAGGVCAGERS